jgi:hypothetical protein
MTSTTSERDRLIDTMASLRRRQRLAGLIAGACMGTLLASGLAVVALAVRAVMRADLAQEWWIALAIVGAGALLGAAVGFLRRPDDLRLARALDRAANSEDRFASALQLLPSARSERAVLALRDALRAVASATPVAAIPMRVPKATRWAGVSLLASLMIILVAPGPSVSAEGLAPPEISAEQWDEINQAYRDELEELPEPETELDEEIAEMLEQIANLLENQPDKKDALAQIARVRSELERRQREMSGGAKSPREAAAAAAVARSEALREFARTLQEGDYKNAASKLQSLAQGMEAGEISPSAGEFDDMASDLTDLASALSSNKALSEAAKQGSKAAESMSSKELADAMRKLAQQMNQQSDKLNQSDRMSDAQRMLDRLQREMNKRGKCSSCSGKGCSQCNGSGRGQGQGQGLTQGAGKGGSRAGWGSVDDWGGGALSGADDTAPDLVDPAESDGIMTSLPMVSTDEEAESGKAYREAFAEMVKQAEADLGLESVPHAYRDYLRRYFNSIRPEEPAGEEAP